MNVEKNNISLTEHGNTNQEEDTQRENGEKVLAVYSATNEKTSDSEEWVTKKSLLREPGLTKRLVELALKELGIKGEKGKDKIGRTFTYYSPEEQKEIRDYVSSKKYSKDFLTATEVAKELRVTPETVKKAIKRMQDNGQIIGTDGRDSVGREAKVYSREEVELIKSNLDYLLSASEAPKDWCTIGGIADREGFDFHTIQGQIEKIQSQSKDIDSAEAVEGHAFRRSDGGGIYYYYSPDNQQRIIESILDGRAPTGWRTIDEMTKLPDAPSKGTIRKRIDSFLEKDAANEGIRYFKNKIGRTVVYCSPEMQGLILDDLDKVSPGYCTATRIADEWHIDRGTVMKRVHELGIEGHRFKNKNGNSVVFYSPEERKQIDEKIDELLSTEFAPDEYVTIDDLAKEFEGKVSKPSIREKARELFSTEKSFYRNKKGVIARYYSPDEKAAIIEMLERSTSGTSIPENAVAYYLMLAGKSIKQGIRPKWLKNPDTGRRLEIDIFIDPPPNPGFCIEYDGCYYHQDVERDKKKDYLVQEQGYKMIRVRESGCPELSGDYNICIKRHNNNSEDDLDACIKKCFEALGIPSPDINFGRDKKEIMAFMGERLNRKNENGELSNSLI